jgi:hypothetical protein
MHKYDKHTYVYVKTTSTFAHACMHKHSCKHAHTFIRTIYAHTHTDFLPWLFQTSAGAGLASNLLGMVTISSSAGSVLPLFGFLTCISAMGTLCLLCLPSPSSLVSFDPPACCGRRTEAVTLRGEEDAGRAERQSEQRDGASRQQELRRMDALAMEQKAASVTQPERDTHDSCGGRVQGESASEAEGETTAAEGEPPTPLGVLRFVQGEEARQNVMCLCVYNVSRAHTRSRLF